MTRGVRTWISPTTSGPTGRPPSSTTRTSTSGSGRPIDLLGRAFEAVILRPEDGEGRGRLGLPEGVDEAHGARQTLDRPPDHRKRHGRPAVGQDLEAREVPSLEIGLVEELLEHRRDDEGVGDALALDEIEPGPRLELRLDDEPPARPERGHHVGGAGDVVERCTE